MEVFYYLVFGGLAAVVATLELSKTSKDRVNTTSAFNSFKNNYLVVYSLMMGSPHCSPYQILISFFSISSIDSFMLQ
jgi:Sugar-tranasporters, 12 TM